MLKIKWIQDCIKKGKYYFSKHSDSERQNENLLITKMEETILSGGKRTEGKGCTCWKDCMLLGKKIFKSIQG